MRGLKKLLASTAPCHLRGRGASRRFETRDGCRLRGVTKRLASRTFSRGALPFSATHGGSRGAYWQGDRGGLRRGSAVDTQGSRLSGVSEAKRQSSRMLVLSRHFFAYLASRNLTPICGQRGVCSAARRVGTAVDVVAFDAAKMSLVLLELKCGYSGDRTAPAFDQDGTCSMRGAVRRAADCVLNRHFAQLAATLALFTQESTTQARLKQMGVSTSAMLVYCSNDAVDAYELPRWWQRRGAALLADLR